MKVLIYPDVDLWNFVISDYDRLCNAGFYPLRNYSNAFQALLRKRFRNCHFPPEFLLGKRMRKVLKQLSDNDCVIVADYMDVSLLYAISQCLEPGVRKYLWLWNPVWENDYFRRNNRLIKELGFNINTFNPTDAKEFGLVLHNQFYPIHRIYNTQHNTGQPVDYDFFFIGYPKGRESEIEEIQGHISDYRVYIKIVYRQEDYVSYDEYVKRINSTRCLIDISQANQEGITLRALESIAFRKKLLTTNKRIMKMDLYNQNNFFIVCYDDFLSVETFLSSPYYELPPEIVAQYDTEKWLNNFL